MTTTTAGEVLIVDDEEAIADFLAELLTDEGYTVRIARDGQEGLAEIWRRPPGLVLLDVMMPRMSGDQLLVHMRENGFLTLPVIVMSAGANLHRLLDLGATAALTKPIELDDLFRLIQTYITPPLPSEEQIPPTQQAP